MLLVEGVAERGEAELLDVVGVGAVQAREELGDEAVLLLERRRGDRNGAGREDLVEELRRNRLLRP